MVRFCRAGLGKIAACQKGTCLVLGAVDDDGQHVVAEHIVGDDRSERGDSHQNCHAVQVMGVVDHPEHL